MKKIKVLIIALLLLLSIVNVYAGDIPEGILAKYIEHSGMIIGAITAEDEVEVLTVFRGDLEENSILNLEIPDEYFGTETKPAVGDYVVAVLINDNTDIYTGFFLEADGMDYKSLKILGPYYDMVERYQKYINNGDYFEVVDETLVSDDLIEENADIMNTGIVENEFNYSVYYVIVVILSMLTVAIVLFKKIKTR